MEVPTESVPIRSYQEFEERLSILEEDKAEEIRIERYLALLTLAMWAKEWLVDYFNKNDLP